MPGKKKKYNARFPPARIKKIMQSDEDVGKVAAAVPVIISRALELFVENMLKKANEVISQRGARTLTPSHLKMCITSETRFDFLKDLVSGVPDLQGDMDINLDSASTSATADGPPSASIIAPSTSTTSSSVDMPTDSSRFPSSTQMPINLSLSSSTATSSSSYSANSSKKSYSVNKGNISSSTGSCRQRLPTLKSDDEGKSLDGKNDSMNTKVGRKRGRPRKSATEPPLTNKPKKSKIFEEARQQLSELTDSKHYRQYSSSHSDSTDSESETRLHMKKQSAKAKSFEDPATAVLRQISRTYSTGSSSSQNISSNNCTPSPTTPSVPSFTLTFPMDSSNTEQAKPLPKSKLPKSKNTTKTSSSQKGNQLPKLQSDSKNIVSDSHHMPTVTKSNQIRSNNGFPFTISKILEDDHQMLRQDSVKDDTSAAKDIKTKETARHNLPLQSHFQYNNAPQPTSFEDTGSKVEYSKPSSVVTSASTPLPMVNWTMNIVRPTSDDIDEDYDA